LVRELETRVKLELVKFWGIPPARILPLRETLFRSLQRNPNVKGLSVESIDLRTDNLEGMVSFLDGAPALTTLSLSMWSPFGSANNSNPDRASSIAAALQRNNRIENLHMELCGDAILCPIFQSLASSGSVSSLTKITCDAGEGFQSETTAVAFQQYLESTSATIQCLELLNIGFDFLTGSVLRGLRRNTSVTDLAFELCYIEQEATANDDGNKEIARQLANAVGSKPGLTTLRFSSSNFWLYQEFVDAFEEILMRRVNALRCLDMDIHIDYLSFPVGALRAVMVAISRSTGLERLLLQQIDRDEDGVVPALVEGIPLLKIDELVLWFTSNSHHEEEEEEDNAQNKQEEEFLDAFKSNYCLQSVQCKQDFNGQPWFSEANQARLEYYLDRNRKLAQWIANPKMVPRELWSYAIMLAMKAGANSLFQSLIALSEHGVGLKKGRKRKRPQYYKP